MTPKQKPIEEIAIRIILRIPKHVVRLLQSIPIPAFSLAQEEQNLES